MDKVVHFEVPVSDIETGKKFYEDVFGWEIKKTPVDPDYMMVMTGECDDKGMPTSAGWINGGMILKKGPLQAPVLIMKVENLDASMDKIKANGGEILGEVMMVADMGKYVRFKDPQGHVLGIWQDLK